MKIIYKTGDLLKCEEAFLVHGCNAQGVMGSGVAKLLRDADENIFQAYRDRYESNGNRLELGEVVSVPTILHGNHRVVFDAVTQEFYGREPGVIYVSYDGLRKAMQIINSQVPIFTPPPGIAMPLIGAGLAQGSWTKIAEIIEEESTNFQPVVYLIDGVIPTT